MLTDPVTYTLTDNKNIMKRYLALMILTFVSLFSLEAQQDAQYTQYMYNTMIYNPAYAGSRGVFSIESLYRTQWVGLDGAPDTGTFSFNTPVGQGERVGLGLSIINDRIGPSQETYFDASFSYTLPISDVGKLAFGVKGGFSWLNVDFNKLNAFEPNDQFLQTNVDNTFSPNVGLGIYYHTPNFYLGLSAPNMIETDHFDASPTGVSYVAKERVNYYLMSGYVFDLSRHTQFKPATLVKAVEGAPLQVDLSANFLFYEKLILGAAWRWDAAVSGMAGFQLSETLMIGYAYDADTTHLGNFNSGSHELFLRFEILTQGSVLSPRFF